MTRLYGFTKIHGHQHVIGFGKRCFVWCVYIAKVPKRRLKGFCYKIESSNVVFHMKANSDKFRFFGYASIGKEDLMDD